MPPAPRPESVLPFGKSPPSARVTPHARSSLNTAAFSPSQQDRAAARSRPATSGGQRHIGLVEASYDRRPTGLTPTGSSQWPARHRPR